MKFMGSAVIILSLFLVGRLSSLKLTKRAEFIKLIIDFLEFTKYEIAYKKSTISILINNLNKNIYLNKLDILEIFYNNLNNKKSSESSWSLSVNQSKIKNILNKDELCEIKKIGTWLGKSSIENQISNIELSLEYLKQKLIQAQNDKNKYYKIYNNMGFLSGVALVILIW